MKRMIVICTALWLIAGCTHIGAIDKSRITGKTSYALNTGQKITLPLRYKNWKWMMATYAVPVSQIENILPAKLKPILISPKTALISFGVLEYPNVSALKPYDEWLISIPVEYDPSVSIPLLPLAYNPLFPYSVYKKGGNYIYHLPVTTAESQQAGKEIWGFPKVLRQIKCTENLTSKSCDLIHNGETVMSLQVEKIDTNDDKREFAYCAYTEKDKQLLRTCLIANGNYNYSIFAKASIKFGKGIIANKMRHLQIEYTNPLQVFRAENLDSILPLEYERMEK